MFPRFSEKFEYVPGSVITNFNPTGTVKKQQQRNEFCVTLYVYVF